MPASQARLPFSDDCPVSLDVLGTLYRGDAEVMETVLADIPSATRARLATYLYGKSHLHALGLRVASACTETDLVRVAGHAGRCCSPSPAPRRAAPRSAIPASAASASRAAAPSPERQMSVSRRSPLVVRREPMLMPRLRWRRRPRRGGRAVECTALEMRHGRKSIGGSNPSLSARHHEHHSLVVFLAMISA